MQAVDKMMEEIFNRDTTNTNTIKSSHLTPPLDPPIHPTKYSSRAAKQYRGQLQFTTGLTGFSSIVPTRRPRYRYPLVD